MGDNPTIALGQVHTRARPQSGYQEQDPVCPTAKHLQQQLQKKIEIYRRFVLHKTCLWSIKEIKMMATTDTTKEILSLFRLRTFFFRISF